MRWYYEDYVDGIDWHDYWANGFETYYDFCGQELHYGGHTSIYFSQWMKDMIVLKGGTISETDLHSRIALNYPTMYDWPYSMKTSRPVVTADSIARFTSAEYDNWTLVGEDVYPVVWLLADNSGCADPGGHPSCDHWWHWAYGPAGPPALYWFRLWWREIW